MTSHLATDVLSAYLDRELAQRQAVRVERHLVDCAACQQRLDGLRRVVADLKRAGAPTMPSTVVAGLRHRLRAEQQPRGFLQRFEDRLREMAIPQTSIVLVFALVMTLVGLVYVFVWGVDRAGARRDQRVDPAAGLESVEEVVLSGRTFVRSGDAWIEATVIDRPIARRLGFDAADEAAILGRRTAARRPPALGRPGRRVARRSGTAGSSARLIGRGRSGQKSDRRSDGSLIEDQTDC